MADHFENIFHNYTFGYRKYNGDDIRHFLHLLKNGRNVSTNTDNVIGTIAIDLGKAFDCKSHDLSLEKLKFFDLIDHALF